MKNKGVTTNDDCLESTSFSNDGTATKVVKVGSEANQKWRRHRVSLVASTIIAFALLYLALGFVLVIYGEFMFFDIDLTETQRKEAERVAGIQVGFGLLSIVLSLVLMVTSFPVARFIIAKIAMVVESEDGETTDYENE